MFGMVALLIIVITGVWALLHKLDSAVIANGVVAVESNRKVVQHLEGGIVSEILVENADMVTEGQVLIRLQPTVIESQFSSYDAQLAVLQLRRARLESELQGQETFVPPPDIDAVRWAGVIENERQVQQQRWQLLNSRINILSENIAQLQKQIEGIVAERNSAYMQKQSLEDELVGVSALADKGFVSITRVLAMRREIASLSGEIGYAESRIRELHTDIDVREREKQHAFIQFRTQSLQEIQDVQSNIIETQEGYDKTADQLQRINILAPHTGVIQNLTVFTIGGVIPPYATLMEIVPRDSDLIIDARIDPLDRDLVETGQRVEVRFPGFSEADSGVLNGELISISPDTVFDPNLQIEFFRGAVRARYADLPVEIADNILPGVPSEIIIFTGNQSFLDYLFNPLWRSISLERATENAQNMPILEPLYRWANKLFLS